MGKSLIYYNGRSVGYSSYVKVFNDTTVPKDIGTWAQGGIGLYLGYTNWLVKVQNETDDTELFTGRSYRTAMLCNMSDNSIYLFMCRMLVTVQEFRQSIIDYTGVKDTINNSSNSNWRAIMLDGGQSAQIYGPNGFSYASPLVRKVVQIVGIAK